ncbi:MAG TPA: ATP-binding protein [Nodosilinea sp.]|nr:ATP-binding protein [Nodosilinea sp.]
MNPTPPNPDHVNPPRLWIPPPRLAQGLIVAGLGLVLLTDRITPLGFAHGSLYPLLVAMAGLTRRRGWVVGVTAVSLGLTAIGFWLSPSVPTMVPYGITNRLVSAIAIITTGGLTLIVRRYITQVNAARQTLSDAYDTLRSQQTLLQIASEIGHLGGWQVQLGQGPLAAARVVWSAEVARIHGVEPGFIPTVAEAMEFYAPQYRDRIATVFTACAQQGLPFDEELQIVTAQGQPVWVRSIGQPIRDAQGAVILVQGAFQDISAPRQAAAALASSEQRFRQLAHRLNTILESITDAFITLDRQWRFTFVNRHAEQLLRRSRADLLGQLVWDEFPELRHSPVEQQYRQALATDRSVKFREFYPPLKRWFEVQAYPSSEGLAVYFQDITDRIALEERLQQAQRLEAIGQLTGGVAHDFNNLLTVMMGNAELLSEALEPDPRLHPLATLIGSAAQRGAELTQRLLAFARRQPLDPRAVDVNQLLAATDGLLRRTLGEHIAIERVPAADLWPALIDPAQLESALLNLCLNARDAMAAGGQLTLETANIDLDATYASHNLEVTPGHYVMVAVSDTGTGIAPEHLEHVFEPFFTTKETGKGTGLGLSMVYGFVKQSGGHIKIYSEPGQGTTVRLYLPRFVGGAEPPTAAVAAAADGGSELILLVEDDESVRRYAQAQLAELGYRVLEAATGPAALALVRQHPDIDLLFTDVVMPGGMSGHDLARQARQLRPGLRVLYTSGYSENVIVNQGRLDAGVQLLSKPYGRADLSRKLRQALAAPSP